MPKTLIAVPCFDMVHADFMESIVNLQKPENSYFTKLKNTMIYIARNIIAANAVENGFDRVFWCDSDMKIPPDALLKLSKDMDETGAGLVTGLYFTRKTPPKPVIYKSLHWTPGGYDSFAENHYQYPEGITEIAACGFGCCLTSVDLIKKIGDATGSPFTPLEGMGEDLSFCFRAIQTGEKMYCDTTVKCGHIGDTEYNEAMYREFQVKGAYDDSIV